LGQFFVTAAAFAEAWSPINVGFYSVQVAEPIVFNGLKDNVIIRPQETNRFRLKVTLKNEKWPNPAQWTCSISRVGDTRGMKAISSSDATIEFLN